MGQAVDASDAFPAVVQSEAPSVSLGGGTSQFSVINLKFRGPMSVP